MAQRNNYQPDILSYLAEVVKQNTRAYAADFDYDAKRLWDSAQETDMERRSFLWMSRLHGTWCVSEREAFFSTIRTQTASGRITQTTPEGILAYRIVVEGIRDGKLAGKVIPLDYAKQVRRVMQSALPVAKIQYRDKNEYFCENSYHAFVNSTHALRGWDSRHSLCAGKRGRIAAHFNVGASDGTENETLLPDEIYCAAAITGSIAFGDAALASTAFVPQTPLVRVYPKTPRRIASQLGTQ